MKTTATQNYSDILESREPIPANTPANEAAEAAPFVRQPVPADRDLREAQQLSDMEEVYDAILSD